MLLRIAMSLGFVCGCAHASDDPWVRFFKQPAENAQDGIQHAMSKAVASAFSPLGSKPVKATPMLMQPVAVIVEPKACSIPLTEVRVERKFFIGPVKPQDASVDPGAFRLAPAGPCK